MAPQSPENPREFLRTLLTDAIAAAHPENCLPPALAALFPDHGRGQHLTVLGAGKAAAAMARTLEHWWQGSARGAVVTRRGAALPTRQIAVLEADHPEPDAAGEAAARQIMGLAAEATPNDTVVILLSGGASALLTLPAPGLTLADKQRVTRSLLHAGADIGEINTVRRQLSSIKGGRLGQAVHPAKLITLAISDVVGDDPAVIGSGPTVPSPTSAAEAQEVLRTYSIAAPPAVARHLSDARAQAPDVDAAWLDAATYRIIARAQESLTAATETARAHGVHPVLHNPAATGEAVSYARHLATDVRTRLRQDILPKPWLLISGGELTVTVRGDGRGGPNTEFLLALALELEDVDAAIHALAADTDGADGSSGAAGALLTPDTLARARAGGLDPQAYLDNSDSAGFFRQLGDLVETGPTHTNVNDFRAILVT